MNYLNSAVIIGITILLSGCGASSSTGDASDTPDLNACLKAVQKLDEGTLKYTGTIARLNGKFGLFETTSVHSRVDENTWAFQSSGGDAYNEEVSYVRLIGNQMVPLENDEPQMAQALTFTSCEGPDEEGRWTTTSTYSMPDGEDATIYASNLTWTSEHGSYYVEDITDETGRIVARRSGVNEKVAPEGDED